MTNAFHERKRCYVRDLMVPRPVIAASMFHSGRAVAGKLEEAIIRYFLNESLFYLVLLVCILSARGSLRELE